MTAQSSESDARPKMVLSDGALEDLAIAEGMAMAYVWGRQDAGESPKDTGFSMTFASAYRLRKEVYLARQAWNCVPLQDAFREWTTTGRVTYRTRDGYREIVNDSSDPYTPTALHDRPVTTPVSDEYR